jgi:uncharacterized membrane protein YhaH (DUF805 family)
MNEFTNVLKHHYFDFTGRARRQEFWKFTLVSWLLPFLVGLIFGLIDGISNPSATSMTSTPLGLFTAILVGAYWLAILPPSIAIGVRRLHDIGQSGWLMLLGLVGLSIVLLVLDCFDSKPETNKWGPSPKRTGNITTAF